jgi:hypothetical protein
MTYEKPMSGFMSGLWFWKRMKKGLEEAFEVKDYGFGENLTMSGFMSENNLRIFDFYRLSLH